MHDRSARAAGVTLDVLTAWQIVLDAGVAIADADHAAAGFTLLSAVGGLDARALDLPVEPYDAETHFDAVARRR